jgi:hypothetical protein
VFADDELPKLSKLPKLPKLRTDTTNSGKLDVRKEITGENVFEKKIYMDGMLIFHVYKFKVLIHLLYWNVTFKIWINGMHTFAKKELKKKNTSKCIYKYHLCNIK